LIVMKQTTPRILAATAIGPTVLQVKWQDESVDRIDLSDWIRIGGDTLAPLRDPDVFGNPCVADYGASIAWDGDDDLRIDAVHLERIAADSPRKTA